VRKPGGGEEAKLIWKFWWGWYGIREPRTLGSRVLWGMQNLFVEGEQGNWWIVQDGEDNCCSLPESTTTLSEWRDVRTIEAHKGEGI